MRITKLLCKLSGWDTIHSKSRSVDAIVVLEHQKALLDSLTTNITTELSVVNSNITIGSRYVNFQTYLNEMIVIENIIRSNDYLPVVNNLEKSMSLDDFLVDQYGVPYSVEFTVELLAKQNKELIELLKIKNSKSDYYQTQLTPYVILGSEITEALVSIAIRRCEANFWISLDLLLKKFIERLVR